MTLASVKIVNGVYQTINKIVCVTCESTTAIVKFVLKASRLSGEATMFAT